MNAFAAPILRPQSIDELIQCVGDHARLQIVGASTKSAMTKRELDVPRCVMTGISGIVDHQPSEFLITALAGTKVSELQTALAEHGQYFPFDPPFSTKGATIGGTVAAGLSGAGRLRFGGLRDFIVGIRLIDGLGNDATGGGRVVKNAAGYDTPKLLVGSAGYLGAIVEVTLKVFPKPTHQRTLCINTGSLANAVSLQVHLSRSPIDLAAIDLTTDGSLWIRIDGEESALDSTTDRIARIIDQCDQSFPLRIVDDATPIWKPLDDGSFAEPDCRLVRVPITPTRVIAIDTALSELTVRRRYSVAGNVVWIAWSNERPVQQLDDALKELGLGGTILTGDVARYRIGIRPNASMIHRVKHAFDPDNRFVGCP